jgi:hypothetical protein
VLPYTSRSRSECRVRTIFQFTLTDTYDGDAAAFTGFANNFAKEFSFGRMHQSV